MGLAVRVIPTLLHKRGQLVKGRGFNATRVVGHALQAAKIHDARHVDEMVIFDVAASCYRRSPDFQFVEALAECCYMPVTYGGGVRTIEDIRRLLSCGADKVAIGTEAAKNPSLIADAAAAFGSQAVVLCVDLEHGMVRVGKELWNVNLFDYLAKRSMAGELILQCVERDGTMEGYDLDTIAKVAKMVEVPVIASGGCKDYADMKAAIDAGASAVAAGALFQFTSCTPKGAVEYLAEQGIEVRYCEALQ